MGLSEQERDEWAARIREELEAEHQSRLRSLQRKRERNRDHARRKRAQHREVELSDLKDELRAAFYKEQGYRRYTDSTGREKWVTPEEYEWLTNRRRHRSRKAVYRPAMNLRTRTILMYAGMAAFAVVLGLLLVKSI